MASEQSTLEQSPTLPAEQVVLEAMSARRLLVAGGIALILAGTVFGDIFAVFVLHQNAGRIGASLAAATAAVEAGDPKAVLAHFTQIGEFLENRGTKVDTHVHIIDFGYLALLLALMQRRVSFSERIKLRLAILFLTGAVLLPVSVFLIHYVGLKYSPLQSIGWASIAADFGGLLVILAIAGELAGVWRHFRSTLPKPVSDNLRNGWSESALLSGGTLLILAGFLHGAWYAVFYLERHETGDQRLLSEIIDRASARRPVVENTTSGVDQSLTAYGGLQAEKAINIAAHSHLIEFGIVAILLAFAQELVLLKERWKRRWVGFLLAGSAILPVFVLLEGRFGLPAGAVADGGGFLIILALSGMLVGVIRHGAVVDAATGYTE